MASFNMLDSFASPSLDYIPPEIERQNQGLLDGAREVSMCGRSYSCY